MAPFAHQRKDPNRRRAVIAIQVGITLVVLLGFAALTVDVGTLYSTRADLQRAADSAALAGASAYTTDEMMQVRQAGGGDTINYGTSLARTRVTQFAGMNASFGTGGTNVAAGDVQTGYIDLGSATSPVQTSPAPVDFNAVRVMVRRDAEGGEDSNGPVQFFFAPVFGHMDGTSSASAVAVFDDRVGGISTTVPGAGILPFTIDESAFYQDLNSGGDNYAYNSDSGAITSSSDGIREIRLYPYPLSGKV